ncbi:MAG: DUF2232 domain-containing protein [Alphaproteobacteria bacterium]|nr:DUF2232 domain-containing protein [Alphaproteobacteria bacterium]
MMPRTIPLAIGAGVLSALMFAWFTFDPTLALMISPFTMLPLILIGLSGTALTSGLAAVSAILVVGLVGGSLSVAALYAAAEAIPALGLSRLALRKRVGADGVARFTVAGPLILSAAFYMAALFLVLYVALMGRENGMLGALSGQFSAFLGTLSRPDASPADIATSAETMALLFPGMAAAWWLVIVLLNLSVAERLLAKWGRNLRPALSLGRMYLPRWLVALFGVCSLLGLVGDGDLSFIGWTLGLIFVVPFMFVGMVCLHALCRNWGPGPLALIGCYLFMIILIVSGYGAAPILAVAALGIAEQWIKLRDRIGGPRPV